MIGISVSASRFIPVETNCRLQHPSRFPSHPSSLPSYPPCRHLSLSCRKIRGLAPACSKSSESETSAPEDDWLKRLPEKTRPLYAHSLPCIEAWLRNLGFQQSKEDRAVWYVELPEWHAQLSLDITDLYIRYLKTGPGNLDKDMERRFSYALSREDIQNAILGGP